MLSIPGNHIGDVWFFAEEELVHAYFLTAADHEDRFEAMEIGHATSKDLTNWTIHGTVLKPGPEGDFDETSLATGSVIREGDTYYMAYTGHMNAQTGFARSTDLYTWEKCAKNPNSRIDTRYYEAIGSGERKMPHWRDPYIIRYQGEWIQLVCASRPDAPEGKRGTVGLARSKDLDEWEILPPLDIEPFCEELECPQIFERDGRWYLIFSTFPMFIPEDSQERIAASTPVEPTTYTLMAERFEGPYRLAKEPRIVPPELPPRPYACQLVHFKGKDYCLGTVRYMDGPDFIIDPVEVEFTEDGINAVL